MTAIQKIRSKLNPIEGFKLFIMCTVNSKFIRSSILQKTLTGCKGSLSDHFHQKVTKLISLSMSEFCEDRGSSSIRSHFQKLMPDISDFEDSVLTGYMTLTKNDLLINGKSGAISLAQNAEISLAKEVKNSTISLAKKSKILTEAKQLFAKQKFKKVIKKIWTKKVYDELITLRNSLAADDATEKTIVIPNEQNFYTINSELERILGDTYHMVLDALKILYPKFFKPHFTKEQNLVVLRAICFASLDDPLLQNIREEGPSDNVSDMSKNESAITKNDSKKSNTKLKKSKTKGVSTENSSCSDDLQLQEIFTVKSYGDSKKSLDIDLFFEQDAENSSEEIFSEFEATQESVYYSEEYLLANQDIECLEQNFMCEFQNPFTTSMSQEFNDMYSPSCLLECNDYLLPNKATIPLNHDASQTTLVPLNPLYTDIEMEFPF
jgi:hypothetical protein